MLRTAIIGCGGIAQVHALALSERSDAIWLPLRTAD